VTVERIVSPRGERIEDVGVAPTLPVALTAQDMEHGDDAQLRAAVGVVTGRRADAIGKLSRSLTGASTYDHRGRPATLRP